MSDVPPLTIILQVKSPVIETIRPLSKRTWSQMIVKGPIKMPQSVIRLMSILALSLSFASCSPISQDHNSGARCNVLLDSDGEPVRSKEDSTIDHGNSHDCKSKDDK